MCWSNAANADAPEHRRCLELLEGWRVGRTPWSTTWAILYEFLRVVTHPRVLPRPWVAADALEFVEAILAARSHHVLGETNRRVAVARDLVDQVPALAGNLFHDFHTAVLMKENGLSRIYTRDADFHRFPFIDVVDPLA